MHQKSIFIGKKQAIRLEFFAFSVFGTKKATLSDGLKMYYKLEMPWLLTKPSILMPALHKGQS